MKSGKINVAVVGLGFGKEFIPIYQLHPCQHVCYLQSRPREA